VIRRPLLIALLLHPACRAPQVVQEAEVKTEIVMEATPPEKEVPHETATGLVPLWKNGDTWQVQFRFEVQSFAKVPNAAPYYEQSYWSYVVERADDRRVDIVARGALPGWSENPLRLGFAPDGRLVSLELDIEARPKPHAQQPTTPLVELDQNPHRIALDWPHFPIAEPSQQSFPGDPGELTQTVRRDGDNWIVTMRFERKVPGVPKPVYHQVEQTWEPGRPWWSSIRITYYDSEQEGLELEGHVTRWGPERGRAP